MSKTFVIGDIHGAYNALIQCLTRSNFDYNRDTLIALGDVADGWPETNRCIDELLKIKNLVYILGNHDFWTLEWMESGVADPVWYEQGGKATMESYRDGIPTEHILFLKKALPYYLSNNRLFVHAGIIPDKPLEHQTLHIFLWDRDLARLAMTFHESEKQQKLTAYDEVYIGHTPVPNTPVHKGGVWMMDTGAGWSGVLTIMNIDTRECWASDPVPTLYPGIEGRKRK